MHLHSQNPIINTTQSERWPMCTTFTCNNIWHTKPVQKDYPVLFPMHDNTLKWRPDASSYQLIARQAKPNHQSCTEKIRPSNLH